MPKILVVEDDPDLRDLYHMVLERAGYDMSVAPDTQVARQVLADLTPDVVFLDMAMPGGTGIDVIDYLQADGRFAATKIVVVTANERWRDEAGPRTVDHFLLKPVAIQDLLDLTAQLT